MLKIFTATLLLLSSSLLAQVRINMKDFKKSNGTSAIVKGNNLTVQWPANNGQRASVTFDFANSAPLFKSMGIIEKGVLKEVVKAVDPAFLLTIGKRDLISQNGWNIFFDKVHLKPHQTYKVQLHKTAADVKSVGSRTVIRISEVVAAHFKGWLEVTVYNGSPLVNIAAVMSTSMDSVAIVYDAGLVSKGKGWNSISWADVDGVMQSKPYHATDSSKNVAVKYRTIIGQNQEGSTAVFPAPHQYFYPLDEAFNLKFTWFGNSYRNMVDGYGLGIRQSLEGDKRYVPWFNAPPGTAQRLNFFCMLSAGSPTDVLANVKRFTHNDTYLPLKGYKTLSSHFHNEFIMNVVLAGKPIPDTPSFIKVFKSLGVDIVHLGEFHYTAHPKGPDEQRLNELHALFEQCKRLSTTDFLLLPGEEPNEFLGGHWLQFFPHPVYWIMSRKEGESFISQHPKYGTVYRVKDKEDMLELLKREGGLAWTAHPRTKGSTGYPDAYKEEKFFKDESFLGAAWKPIPADLSQPRLGKRVLDLLDDMSNWGMHKKVLAEADVFTIEPQNEMYAHMNVNYMKLSSLPSFERGWPQVLQALKKGQFFSTTGEVLISSFTVNSKEAGDTLYLNKNGKASVDFSLRWTFPLQFAEVISGDGKSVYRHHINLQNTLPFGEDKFGIQVDLKGRKWVRLEVWDIASNGAFTQTIWLDTNK